MAEIQSQSVPSINPKSYGESPFKAAFASYLINESLRKDLETIKVWLAEHKKAASVASIPVSHEVKYSKGIPLDFLDHPYKAPEVEPRSLKICIVGGGIAGLYTAYILENLVEKD